MKMLFAKRLKARRLFQRYWYKFRVQLQGIHPKVTTLKKATLRKTTLEEAGKENRDNFEGYILREQS